MPRTISKPWLIVVFAALATAAICAASRAEVPNSYGDYFRQSYGSTGMQGAPGTNRYLYDKYFYHRESVSPYMNVFRPDTARGTSYQAYVRPELQRRAATSTAGTYLQQKQPTRRAAPTPSAYHNHWYGGWTK